MSEPYEAVVRDVERLARRQIVRQAAGTDMLYRALLDYLLPTVVRRYHLGSVVCICLDYGDTEFFDAECGARLLIRRKANLGLASEYGQYVD